MEENKFKYYLLPVFQLMIFVLFLLLSTIPFGLIAQFNFFAGISFPLLSELVLQVSLIIIVLSALLMMFEVFPELDFNTVFVIREHAISYFIKGSAIGFAIMVICAAVLYLNGNVSFAKSFISWDKVGLYLLYFLLISLFEELLFRTFPLFVIADKFSIWIAVMLNGLLFAFAHLANPGFTVLAAVNIALAGLVFSIYTLQKGNIAWAVGMHFGWNFTQAIILGYKVSGNDIKGAVIALPQGADYLSGGSFGIEGSVFCTILLIGYCGYLVYPQIRIREKK